MTWQSCFCKRLFRSTSTWLFKSVKTLQSPVVNLRELILPFNSPIFEIEIETQFTSRLFLLCLKFAFCNSGRLLRIVCRSGIWEKMNCLYAVLGDNQMSAVSETRFTSRLVLVETQFTSRLVLVCNSGRLLWIVFISGIWEKMNGLYAVIGDNQMSAVSETRFTSRLVLLRHLEMFATVTRGQKKSKKKNH